MLIFSHYLHSTTFKATTDRQTDRQGDIHWERWGEQKRKVHSHLCRIRIGQVKLCVLQIEKSKLGSFLFWILKIAISINDSIESIFELKIGIALSGPSEM